MTAKDLLMKDTSINITYIEDIEAVSLTIMRGEECLFQKTVLCCPKENKKNLENLIYSKALDYLTKTKKISIN